MVTNTPAAHEFTPGVEAAIFKLDYMVRKDKSDPLCVFVAGDGKPTAKVYAKDGSTKTLTLIGGEWTEQREIIGGEG
jgi:hypothetical protein